MWFGSFQGIASGLLAGKIYYTWCIYVAFHCREHGYASVEVFLSLRFPANKKSLLMHTFWSHSGSWITLKEWIGELAKFRRWSCCYRATVNGHRCKYLILVI